MSAARAPSPPAPSYAPPAPAEGTAVARVLRDEPTSFSFFQAVRLLEQLAPGRAAVGRWADPADEAVRFAASTSLGFPPSEIQDLTDAAPGESPPRMTVAFFGLTGPQGVLPHVYTEHSAARVRARDTAFRDFLDVFHHRLLSLFYRAWAKRKPAVSYEAAAARGAGTAEDQLRDHLLDLSGLGTAGLRARQPLADDALAFYGGLLAGRPRPADGLARLIADYFDVPATVEQFVGEWCTVTVGGQCALGADDDGGRLGFGILGDAAWDPQAKVRLRIGPIDRARFQSFLPGGDAHEPLRALARLYADDQVSVEAQLVLARDAVPPCTLDLPPPRGAGASALGRGTWLASRPLGRDPDETTLRLC